MFCVAATPFQGSPTQKPSMLSTLIFATICGGGMVIIPTDLELILHAASQFLNHISCVPPGNVIAKVTSLRPCTFLTAAATLFISLKPTSPQKSFDSVIDWPLLFSTIAI